MTPWRILLDGPQSGARNMAVDAAVLRAVEAGEAPPTLRLYSWKPWCVSLGSHQNPARELEASALKARGWDVVPRPTGGRAVLHTDELTYSILARRDTAGWCASLALSYERIGEAWAAALQDFGLDMVRGSPLAPERVQGLGNLPAAPCFASSAKSELAFGGRKVVGSAQRRTREAFVQHGSIPLSPDHERLVEVLPLDEAAKAAYLSTLRAHAISLGEITAVPGPAARAAWERGLSARLLAALGIEGEEGRLTESEEAFAHGREAALRAEQERFFGGRGERSEMGVAGG